MTVKTKNIFVRLFNFLFAKNKNKYKKKKQNLNPDFETAKKELAKAILEIKLSKGSQTSPRINANLKVFPMQKYINKDLPNLRKLSQILNKPLTFIDLETTGRPHERQFAIIELGVLYVTPTEVLERGTLIYPEMRIPSHITDITGITNDMVKGFHIFEKYAPYCAKVAREHVLLGYNSKSFDSKGLEKMILKHGFEETYNNQLDIFHLFLRCKKNFDGDSSRSGSLVEACRRYKIQVSGQAHRAQYDIAITGLLAEKLLELYGFGILHKDIMKLQDSEAKRRYYAHLVKNSIPTIS